MSTQDKFRLAGLRHSAAAANKVINDDSATIALYTDPNELIFYQPLNNLINYETT